jgi:hypothetical protein
MDGKKTSAELRTSEATQRRHRAIGGRTNGRLGVLQRKGLSQGEPMKQH